MARSLQKLIDAGEIVLRAYTPPPIAPYDPNEVLAPSPASIAAEQRKVETAKRRADQIPYSAVGWSFALAGIFWGVVYEGAVDKASWDFAHVAAMSVSITIAALLTLWFVACCRALAKTKPLA